ncbi:hypothetical protein FOA43_003560 [Brettanomyces nanus]|uniref:ABC transporter domain-containing protein n=1 Tax=Eeniella nana TaxID=13502 RepID=A0A875SB80_EENNA|nr:uncharacterized protein FOA43_003560 [Brettanomyces nanus]QPG76174.1 hypothetical protein FOA43_003560 [Brettanomyces nanus]
MNNPIEKTIDTIHNDKLEIGRRETVGSSALKVRPSSSLAMEIDPETFVLKDSLQELCEKNSDNGIIPRPIDVIFQHMSTVGRNNASNILIDAGTAFFYMMFFPVLKLIQRLNPHKAPKPEKFRTLIKDFTGIVKAGSLTLVIGRPGSGCSTLLKTLAGHTSTFVAIEGDIQYNEIPADRLWSRDQNRLAYIPEEDSHFPFLTVQQTLKFAIACKMPRIRFDQTSQKTYVNTMTDFYTTLLGLNHVKDTLVGNEFVGGISGGERKRVTIAETMATGASEFCYDNAIRGLDSAIALEFVRSLRTFVSVCHTTIILSAYQASENIYNIFDNVLVLYSGHEIYFGPVESAVQYFINMGYAKFPRQTSSDFLTSITNPSARVTNNKSHHQVPQTPEEFEFYWLNSEEYGALIEQISAAIEINKVIESEKDMNHIHQLEKSKIVRKGSPYVTNFFQQLYLCNIRCFQTIRNNTAFNIALLVAAIVQSLIAGSLFYALPNNTTGIFPRGGTLFVSLLYFCVMSLAEVAVFFENRPILFKQRAYLLYHPSAELLARITSSFIIRFVTIIFFSLILYFLTGLRRQAGAFFSFLLFVNLGVLAVNLIFNVISVASADLAVANACSGLLMLSMLVYSSYMVQRPSMYWWFKWFSYCNPILYSFESMITMQFHNHNIPCANQNMVPTGGQYNSMPLSNRVCAFPGAAATRDVYPDSNFVQGDIYLAVSFDYFFKHCWRNLGILFLFAVGLLAIGIAIVETYNPLSDVGGRLLFLKGKLPTQTKDVEAQRSSSENRNDEGRESTGDDPKGEIERLGSNDTFCWSNLCYSVKQNKMLLNDVSGYALPAKLTALMGESGAGKTTLLNVLAERTGSSGIVTGRITVNGELVGSDFHRRTGYVQQQDVHLGALTVRESLIFTARMKRSYKIPDVEKLEYVEHIIRILGIQKYADAIVGNLDSGLNVEQRKKLSIATELVSKPSLVLFLDEPTSGLDSQSAWDIIQVLKTLARAGQTVICSIHQPSAVLFEQFDQIMLFQKGGRVAYSGNIGDNSKTVLDYFVNNGGRKCGLSENPAEYILDVIGAGITTTNTLNWGDIWLRSEESQVVKQRINELDHFDDIRESQKKDSTEFQVPYWFQFWYVLQRTSKTIYRDLHYVLSKFVIFLTVGLLIGFTFWNVNHSIVGMQNAMFANFMSMVLMAPMVNHIQSKVMRSREIYEARERMSGTFHCNVELSYLMPPEGQKCGEYLEEYFQSHTGYVENPNATENCGVCQYAVGDQYLASIGIYYSDRWRNIGFFVVYIVANIVAMLTLYYLFRVRKIFTFKQK